MLKSLNEKYGGILPKKINVPSSNMSTNINYNAKNAYIYTTRPGGGWMNADIGSIASSTLTTVTPSGISSKAVEIHSNGHTIATVKMGEEGYHKAEVTLETKTELKEVLQAVLATMADIRIKITALELCYAAQAREILELKERNDKLMEEIQAPMLRGYTKNMTEEREKEMLVGDIQFQDMDGG